MRHSTGELAQLVRAGVLYASGHRFKSCIPYQTTFRTMMRIAEKESRKGYGKYRIGAVITDRKGVVVGRGYNKGVTHPTFGNSYSGNLHAETSALVSALKSKRSLHGGTCYVYRVGGNLAKPCPCCQQFLRSHGITTVVYSTKEGNKEEKI